LVKKYLIIIGLKQFHIMTSLKQTSLFTEEKLTSSQGDFHANRTQVPESEKERKMNATSGRKCLEQLEKFNHVGLWAKTFSALLIGQGDWYSTRCKLTWKLRGTKYGRMYCQLYPSTLPIEEIGFGLLLKTPSAMDSYSENLTKKEQKFGNSGTLAQEVQSGFIYQRGLLPTPTAMDSTNATATMKSNQVKEGSMHSVTLTRAMSMGMLPTPIAGDWKGQLRSDGTANMLSGKMALLHKQGMLPTPTVNEGKNATFPESQINRSSLIGELMKTQDIGKTSQLNPLFVLEMMGFPPTWTTLPFLSGETNQSKQPATQ
jgi:hypothetical protein